MWICEEAHHLKNRVESEVINGMKRMAETNSCGQNPTLTSDHIGGTDFGEEPSEPVSPVSSPSPSGASSCISTLLKSIPGGITCKCSSHLFLKQ